MSVEPRSRATRARRKKNFCCKEEDPKTCPRCGNPCHVLIVPYYDSPWAEWGGICCECCADAAKHFNVEGWPGPKAKVESTTP